MFSNKISNFFITIFTTVGLSGLNLYSATYIFIKNKINYIYNNNNFFKMSIDTGFNIVYSICNYFQYKIEPFYDIWLSLYCINKDNEYIEGYYNISKLAILHDNCLNITKPVIDNINKYEIVSKDFLILLKINNKYISRFINTNNIEKIKINPVKKGLLCVEYSHPKMNDKVFLNIDSGFFIENNTILTPAFIKRCLVYQKIPHEFDMDYTIHILDNKMKFLNIDCNSYILITANGYQVCCYGCMKEKKLCVCNTIE